MKILATALKPATYIALALAMALLCAAWLWKIVGPREVARVAASAAVTASPDLAAAGKLFGTVVVAPAAAPVNPLADVLLTGVYRARDGEAGFAVVKIGNQAPRSIMAGAEIRPGLKLARLGTDHAVFAEAGREARLDLPARPALIVKAAPK